MMLPFDLFGAPREAGPNSSRMRIGIDGTQAAKAQAIAARLTVERDAVL
jgi:hypothetical protein